MVKLHWRKGVCFLVALACATGVLVAAGLAEDARVQPADTTGGGRAGAAPGSLLLNPWG